MAQLCQACLQGGRRQEAHYTAKGAGICRWHYKGEPHPTDRAAARDLAKLYLGGNDMKERRNCKEAACTKLLRRNNTTGYCTAHAKLRGRLTRTAEPDGANSTDPSAELQALQSIIGSLAQLSPAGRRYLKERLLAD